VSGWLNKYSDYKDSGVDWIGRIPSEWDCRQLKYVAALSIQKATLEAAGTYVGMENISSGDGKYIATSDMSPEGQSLKFQQGDVLFGKLRPYLAKSWLATFSGICSSEFLVLRTAQLEPRYLNYMLLSRHFIAVVDSSTYGTKMPRASWDFIGMLKIPVPERALSEKIAKFLDYETAKIDALIAKQQQIIALLQEKRQAVISHAVTKGLNPAAPLRDSGVAWLGAVPAHWEVGRLKYFASTTNGFGFSSSDFQDEGIPFIRAGNIKKWSVTPPNIFLPEKIVARYDRLFLEEGEVIISMVGSDPKVKESAVGQVGIVPSTLSGSVPNQNVVIMREYSSRMKKRFLFHTLCSSAYRNHLDVFSHKLALNYGIRKCKKNLVLHVK